MPQASEEALARHATLPPNLAGRRLQAKAEVNSSTYPMLAVLAERDGAMVASTGRHEREDDEINFSYGVQQMVAGHAVLAVDCYAFARNRVLAERERCRSVYEENLTLRALLRITPRPKDTEKVCSARA
eukprot:6493023-Prymnesium_polylepis.1